MSRHIPIRGSLAHPEISNASTQEALQPPQPPQKTPPHPSPFNVVEIPAGSEANEEEGRSMHHFLMLPSTLTTLSKDCNKGTSEHGRIPPALTSRKQPSWATGTGSFTYPRQTARGWKYSRANSPQTTSLISGHRMHTRIRTKRPAPDDRVSGGGY